MLDRSRLSRLITLALASCAVTWAFAAGAFARPDITVASATPAPVYKAVAGDTDKAPSANRPPAFKAIVVDANKVPDPVVVNRNLAASLGHGPKSGPKTTAIVANDDNTDTIALITAIAAMLVALAAVTYIAVRPQPPVLRA
jgi:hypothetical protein